MLIFYSYNSINIKNTEQWRNWIILNNYFPIYFIEPNHFLISNYYNRIGLSGCHGLCSSRPTVTFTSAIWSLWWMKGWVDLWTLVVAIDPGSMLIFCSSHQWQCVALLSVTPPPLLINFISGFFLFRFVCLCLVFRCRKKLLPWERWKAVVCPSRFLILLVLARP